MKLEREELEVVTFKARCVETVTLTSEGRLQCGTLNFPNFRFSTEPVGISPHDAERIRCGQTDGDVLSE
jgi:hypothetical protein